MRRSAPPSRRWVAKEWRSVCGLTPFLSPAGSGRRHQHLPGPTAIQSRRPAPTGRAGRRGARGAGSQRQPARPTSADVAAAASPGPPRRPAPGARGRPCRRPGPGPPRGQVVAVEPDAPRRCAARRRRAAPAGPDRGGLPAVSSVRAAQQPSRPPRRSAPRAAAAAGAADRNARPDPWRSGPSA